MEGPIQYLPHELKLYIVDFIRINDLVNLRRTSRVWSDVCTRGLFRDGVIVRPHHHDMERLLKISECPWLAKGVEKVVILVGDMDTTELEHALLSDQSGRPSILGYQYRSVIMDILDKMNNGPSGIKHCDKDVLFQAFGRFPNLKSLSASSCTFPFTELDVRFKSRWESMIRDVRRVQ